MIDTPLPKDQAAEDRQKFERQIALVVACDYAKLIAAVRQDNNHPTGNETFIVRTLSPSTLPHIIAMAASNRARHEQDGEHEQAGLARRALVAATSETVRRLHGGQQTQPSTLN